MRANILAPLFAAAVAFSAHAQETAAPADGTEPEQATPKEQVVAVHGDWQIRCRTTNGKDLTGCFMYQLAIDSREKPIAEISIVSLAGGGDAVAGFTVLTPLRTMLARGLSIQIDSSKPEKFPYVWCAEVGCFSRFGTTQAALDQYKRGGKARVTVFSIENPEAPIILDVSLTGFTAAFNDLLSK